MTTITPHRDSAIAALALATQVRARLPQPPDSIAAIERRAANQVVDTVILSVADMLDLEAGMDRVSDAVEAMLCNALVGFTMNVAASDTDLASQLARHLLDRIEKRASWALREFDPNRWVRGEITIPERGSA